MLGEYREAEELARDVLEENPQFTSAYDFLGDLLTSKGDKEDALQVLQKAREISPGTLSRIRNMSTLALQTGRFEMAEEIMQEALIKHKYSPVREAGDFVLISKALTEQGKGEKALQALKEAKDSFKDASSKSNIAANESIVHHKLGDHERAAAALEQALAGDACQLSVQAAAGVAEACLSLGQEEKAYDLLKQVIQNNPDDLRVREQVHAVLSSAGKGAEEANAIIDASVTEDTKINNDGVRHAEAGELEEAIALLSNAADRLPNNLQIVSNAALVLALDLVRNAFNQNRLRACLKYREIVTDKDSDYPKLAQIDALLKQVKRT
jgi:tetratricopeptide (TPR) repeat protein